MIQAVDYSKYSRSFIQGFCHFMFSILHQIHISLSTPDSALPSRALIHLIVYQNQAFKTYNRLAWLPLASRHWLSSSSQYPGYPMRKLMSFFTRGRGQLRSTGFSTLPPTVVLKGGKPHASTCGRSIDKLDNLSCVRINEWKYTFQVTYVQGDV